MENNITQNAATFQPPIRRKKGAHKMYTLGEEIFNAITHGVGAGLAIAGCVVLIVVAATQKDVWSVVSSAIFGATLIILYTMSTLYHAITNPSAKKVFRVLDHCTVFLLIAGTYTPFTLVTLRGPLGWTLFGLLWGVTAVGIVFNSIDLQRFAKISTVCYVLMGWCIIFAVKPLLENMGLPGLILLLGGGLCYTGGVAFYIQKKLKYMHSIWHLFVVAGSVLHYFWILFYVQPLR